MRSFFPVTTRARFALIISVTLIPLIGSTIFSYFREREVLFSHINEDVMRVTRTVAGTQEMAINNAMQLLTALAKGLGEDRQSCARLFSIVQNKNPIYESIGLVLGDGTLISTGKDVQTDRLVGKLNEDQEFAIDIWIEETGRKAGFIISHYFHLYPAGPGAVLFAVLDMKRLAGSADIQLPNGAESFLITEKGTVLASSPDHKKGPTDDASLVQTMLARREGTSETKGLDGKTRLYAFRPLSGVADTGIYIAVGFPVSIYSEVEKILAFDFLVLALSMLAGIIIWSLADRTVIRSVDVLVSTARELSGGNMQARTGLDYGSRGEMGRIARALDQMAETLENRTGQLYSYQEKLRSMASELMLVEEKERRLIATEVHDRIGQALAMAKIRMSAQIKACKDRQVGQELTSIRKYVDQAILDTRSIIYKISSPILYELGLESALEWLSEQVQKEHGIHTTFFDDEHEKPLDEDVRVLLFQGVNELLVNAVKHAHAENIVISCKRNGDSIRIEVEDDGDGFDPAEIGKERRSPVGFGLFALRERLQYVRGNLEILSSRGKGARIIMQAALKNAGSS